MFPCVDGSGEKFDWVFVHNIKLKICLFKREGGKRLVVGVKKKKHQPQAKNCFLKEMLYYRTELSCPERRNILNFEKRFKFPSQ